MTDKLKMLELDELTCERLCKNISIAFKFDGLLYYETFDWLIVFYEGNIAASVRNDRFDDCKFRKLFAYTFERVDWLDARLEEALVRLDMLVK